MMSKEKQIEEMAEHIYDFGELKYGAMYCYDDAERVSENLYNAGYRKQSDLIEEFIYRAINLAVCKDNGDGTERLFVSTENLRKIAQEMKGGAGQ